MYSSLFCESLSKNRVVAHLADRSLCGLDALQVGEVCRDNRWSITLLVPLDSMIVNTLTDGDFLSCQSGLMCEHLLVQFGNRLVPNLWVNIGNLQNFAVTHLDDPVRKTLQ